MCIGQRRKTKAHPIHFSSHYSCKTKKKEEKQSKAHEKLTWNGSVKFVSRTQHKYGGETGRSEDDKRRKLDQNRDKPERKKAAPKRRSRIKQKSNRQKRGP